MDLTESLAAKSDQLNAVDVPTPRTFTIEKITEGNDQQPFNFHLVETPGRPWRPSKGMRRVISRGWGERDVAARYPGRRVTLWCNPEVIYAGAPVGGLQVSHMSDIDGPFTMPLRISQKKTTQITVQPLPDAPAQVAPVTSPLVAAFEASGIDKSKWLEYSGQVVGRELTSANDLSAAEQVAVIDALNQDAAEKAAEGGGE